MNLNVKWGGGGGAAGGEEAAKPPINVTSAERSGDRRAKALRLTRCVSLLLLVDFISVCMSTNSSLFINSKGMNEWRCERCEM